ncbi:SPOR domain-containing protein [Erythrobacter sp.]|uniref:SPOR domain-containing protein n=1 Tax=Erythrobacter sp. TaxID=1042 RepID=UPI003C781F48
MADTRISLARRLALVSCCALSLASAPAMAQEKSAGDRADSMFEQAEDLRLGRDVDADFERALNLYRQAAEMGHVEAQANYGLLLYKQGRAGEAMPLIEAAAGRGDPRAQYILGLEHFNADNVPKDWVRAYALVTLANVAGLPQARSALAQMESYIPAGQREEAQQLVRQWQDGTTASSPAQIVEAETNIDRGRVGEPPVRATLAAAPSQTERPARAEAGAQSDWRVQLGTFSVPGNAERLWSRLSGDPLLSGASRELVRTDRFTVLHARGWSNRAEANSACAALKRKGHDCLVVRS